MWSVMVLFLSAKCALRRFLMMRSFLHFAAHMAFPLAIAVARREACVRTLRKDLRILKSKRILSDLRILMYPKASGSTDHDVPSAPRSQDLGTSSMSSGLDDRGVIAVQDFVNPECLDLLETAFMYDGSQDQSYDYSYDHSYDQTYDSSYAFGDSDYSYPDQYSYQVHPQAPYSYDAYYGWGKKGKPKGGDSGFRDPSRGIDIHAGFTTKQAPVLLRGCTWRDAKRHLKSFLKQTELPSERAVPHLVAKSF